MSAADAAAVTAATNAKDANTQLKATSDQYVHHIVDQLIAHTIARRICGKIPINMKRPASPPLLRNRIEAHATIIPLIRPIARRIGLYSCNSKKKRTYITQHVRHDTERNSATEK